MERAVLEDCNSVELGESVVQLHAAMTATQAAMFSFIAAFDAKEGWRADGARSMADWLVAAVGISSATGREWVRMAHALEALPLLAAAFEEGRICLESVAAATALAAPEDRDPASLSPKGQLPSDTATASDPTASGLSANATASGPTASNPAANATTDPAANATDPAANPTDLTANAATEASTHPGDPVALGIAMAGLAQGPQSLIPSEQPAALVWSDAAVTEQAMSMPAQALRAELRRQRIAKRCRPDEHPVGTFSWNWRDDGMLALSGKLPTDEGAVVAVALERIGAKISKRDPISGHYDPAPLKWANALVALARTHVGDDDDADRATVMVHVDARDLAAATGAGTLVDGPPMAMALIRRLACDGRIVASIEGETAPVGIGRVSRQIPHRLERSIRFRDGGCRFPGCGQLRHVQVHHVEHWAAGGPTDLANLLQLCAAHHKLVHEGGWSIEGSPEPGPGPDSTLRFVRPDGLVYQPSAPELNDRFRQPLITWGLLRPYDSYEFPAECDAPPPNPYLAKYDAELRAQRARSPDPPMTE